MSEMYKSHDPEMDDLEQPSGGLNETAFQGLGEVSSVSGTIHISEEVIVELAKKTLWSVPGVQPASPGIASKLGIGRKASDGIRVTVEDKVPPLVTVDVYVMVKYGLRIPDAAWEVQESIKKTIEEYTGYDVKAVNINVQGIYFKDKPAAALAPEAAPVEEKPAAEEKFAEEKFVEEKAAPVESPLTAPVITSPLDLEEEEAEEEKKPVQPEEEQL